MKEKQNETEQLKDLLSKVYKQGNAGATLKDVMTTFKEELPKITEQSVSKV